MSIVGRSLYRAGLRVYDDMSERWTKARHRRLTLERIADQNELQNIRAIFADDHGRYPLLYGKGGILRDPNNLRAFTLQTVRETWPALERLDAIARIVLAGGGWPAAATAERMLPEGAAVGVVSWPSVVTMGEALQERRPTIEDLIVGVYPSEVGGLGVVSDSLHNLMHVLEVGASGWGKSTWLRSFLYQVARAPEPCEVVAIDINGSAFNVLHGWGRLRYPVAREPREAISVLGAVSEEIGRRKHLYEQHPRAENLQEYNEASGADLPPWVVAIDEGTNLLAQSDIGEPLRATVQTARQYGVYVLLAGQSAKHSVIDTQVRDNFTTRLCFRTSPTSSRVVLDDNAAGELTTKGRAWVQMVGRELQEIQGPLVSKDDFIAALSAGGPKYDLPIGAAIPTTKGNDDQTARICELHQAGKSLNEIQRTIFGYCGGAAYDAVKAALGDITTTRGADMGSTDGLGAAV